MGLQALLTLELDEIDEKQRQVFYDNLQNSNWSEIANITTAWTCSFDEEVNRLAALITCKSDVKNAAEKAKISSYDAVLQIGEGEIISFC